MPKNYKRILTPLFFVVIALVVLCCSAFADDVSGVPTISINGNSPIPYVSSINFNDGDEVTVVSSGILSFYIRVPDGVTFTVNPNVHLRVDGINVSSGAIFNNYGDIERVSNSTSYVVINVSGTLNMYYGSLVITTSGTGVYVSQSGIVNMYNGMISGSNYGVNLASEDSQFNFYSGIVSGNDAPFSNSSIVNVIDGNMIIEDNIASIRTNIFGVITDLVSESISWLSEFVNAITGNSILMVFVLLIFTGLGIGLLRRVKSI